MIRARVLLALLLVTAAALPAGAATLDDLLFDLQLVPLESQTPPAASLVRLDDGTSRTLAAWHGRPLLLYFWATW